MITSLHIANLLTVSLLAGNGDNWVDLEPMAARLRGDVRVIVLGDSYAAPYVNRLPIAALRTWPIPFLSAIQGGAPTSSHLVQCIPSCDGTALVQASDPDGFTIERGSKSPVYFGLPARGLQEVRGVDEFIAGEDGELFEFRLRNDKIEDGVHGPFSMPGDTLKFRLLHRVPGDPVGSAVEHVRLVNEEGEVVEASLVESVRAQWHLDGNPETGTGSAVERQLNAVATDIDCTRGPSARHRIRLHESTPLQGTNRYFEPAGGIWYHQDAAGNRLPGFYVSGLGDDGWAYGGFGDDSACDHAHDRTCNVEQLAHWLDVTTLDRQQPTVILWYLAFEGIEEPDARVDMTAMIDRIDEAVEAVGLTDVVHLIVVPHMIRIYNSDGENAHAYAQSQEQIAFDLAAERANVAAASLYGATGGILFDGRSEAHDWLLSRGFEDFRHGSVEVDLPDVSGGNLLDVGAVHPGTDHAAAFFATVLGDLIREAGCPADVHIDGRINILDLLVILENWNAGPGGDVDGDGNTNVLDLLRVIETWGDCWPVQSPFDN